MLLHPRNPCEKLCEDLKLNVDDTVPTKYWTCGSCFSDNKSDLLISTFVGVSCSCGKVMEQERMLYKEDSSKGTAQMDGVLVKKDATYLIFDDLRVLEKANAVHWLLKLGYTDVNLLTEMSLNMGSKQILDILKRALISKSPLTDVFLNGKHGDSESTCFFKPLAKDDDKRGYEDECGYSCHLKITKSKKMNKILFAEANDAFFDFLLSFLTLPLGSILRILDDNVSLGSINTLYRSVKKLSSSWLVRSLSLQGTPLLGLGVAPQYGVMWQPLQLHEEESPVLDVIVKQGMNLFDPRSHDERREHAVGFVKRPSVFAVTDDLQVSSITSKSCTRYFQNLNVPLTDFEEHVVTIDTLRALNLLGASLTSKAALTNGLLNLPKMSKKAD